MKIITVIRLFIIIMTYFLILTSYHIIVAQYAIILTTMSHNYKIKVEMTVNWQKVRNNFDQFLTCVIIMIDHKCDFNWH